MKMVNHVGEHRVYSKMEFGKYEHVLVKTTVERMLLDIGQNLEYDIQLSDLDFYINQMIKGIKNVGTCHYLLTFDKKLNTPSLTGFQTAKDFEDFLFYLKK